MPSRPEAQVIDFASSNARDAQTGTPTSIYLYIHACALPHAPLDVISRSGRRLSLDWLRAKRAFVSAVEVHFFPSFHSASRNIASKPLSGERCICTCTRDYVYGEGKHCPRADLIILLWGGIRFDRLADFNKTSTTSRLMRIIFFRGYMVFLFFFVLFFFFFF